MTGVCRMVDRHEPEQLFTQMVCLMKKWTALLLLFSLLVLGGLQETYAQTSIDIGPRLGFDIAGDVEEFFVGADARIGVGSLPVLLNGTFDFYFVDNYDFWQFSANALYEFGVDNQAFTPYAGAGIGISRYSTDFGVGGPEESNSDVGLNVIGGAIFEVGSLRPFTQAQITFGDYDLFTICGGLLFTIGGR